MPYKEAAPALTGATRGTLYAERGYSAASTGVKSPSAAPGPFHSQGEGPGPLEFSRFGFALIPIALGEKRPPDNFKWAQFIDAGTTEEHVYRWGEQYAGCNWAILWGRPSGVIAVDVDSLEGLRKAEVLGGFGPAPISYHAEHPGHWLFRVPDELLDVGRFVPYPGLEIRGKGSYSVIPPSLHPSGCRYKWRRAPRSFDDIPQAPTWVLDLMRQRVGGAPEVVDDAPKPTPQTPQLTPETPATSPTETPADDRDNAPGEILATTNRALLQSHALWFLAHGVFPGPTDSAPGCRNQAAYCYVLLLKGAGIPQETATARLVKWATRQRPEYGTRTDERPRAIVQAAYGRPYRPQVDRLLSLVTIDGNRLTRRQAQNAVRFFPQYRQEGSWTHQPALDAVLRVLKVLARRRVLRPTAISLAELAAEAGVTTRRVEEIARFLDRLGIRTNVQRIGRSSVSTFNLSPFIQRLRSIKGTEPRTHHVCFDFVGWREYRGEVGAVLRWLRRRLGRLLQTIVALLDAVLNDVPETSWCETDMASSSQCKQPDMRAPPYSSRALDTLTAEPSPVFVA